MAIQNDLSEEERLMFLKWVQVIQQENLAVKLDSMYVLEKDKVACDVIFIDSNGNKRKISSGQKGDPGDISILNFEIDDNFHLNMNLQTNTELNFIIDNNGHLILIK